MKNYQLFRFTYVLLLSILAGRTVFSSNPRFLSETEDAGFGSMDFSHGGDEAEKLSPSEGAFWMYVLFATFLCCGAGLMSGLTVGYLSIDELQLELKMKNGTEEEKGDAEIISQILADHHLLLSTLLVANALCMEALPICLDKIVPSYLAVIISTVFVVIFGEIIPQAYCTGPSQLSIAKRMAPVVRLLQFIFYPICRPIATALDRILGTHQKTRFVKSDLKAIIELHQIDKTGKGDHHHGGHGLSKYAQLTAEETKVINSTIDLKETPVTKEMVTMDNIFLLSDSARIDKEMIARINRSGFSKIPIYKGSDKNNIRGILRVKSLINFPEKMMGSTIAESNLPLGKPLVVSKDTSMLDMLTLFQDKRTGIALISEKKVKDKIDISLYSRRDLVLEPSNERIIGLISLKDLFEEILETKMEDDDPHNPVTIMSGMNKKRKTKPELKEVSEAEESREMAIRKPLLK